MKTYKEIIFQIPDNAIREILMAQLDEMGYEGFEEDGDLLKAYIPEEQFDNAELQNLNSEIVSLNTIQERNWNAEWESSFSPVVVDELVAIRADFHESVQGVQYEIIITPKMSFGTGHHATTFLMMQQMRKIDFKNKTVFDFGTGTGILAILAEKLGSVSVSAIDNDVWSIENAKENAEKNSCCVIDISLENEPAGKETFDIILANINKNVILTYISMLVNRLNKNGQLLLSGLLNDDEPDILEAAKQLPIRYISTTHKNNWICIMFSN